MTGTAAELIDRLTVAAAADPAGPGVVTADGTLDRATLLQRIHGAAHAAADRDELRVRPDDPRVWLPWLAGCALGGALVRFDANGIGAPPPTRHAGPEAVDAETPCLAVATSGTSGAPKALIRDTAAWLRCFAAEETHLGLSPADRILALGAPAFSLTPYAALRALHLGVPFGVLDTVTPERAEAVLTGLRPTVVYGAPPLVMTLARCAQARRLDVPVSRVITGGAALMPAQMAAVMDAWPGATLTVFHGAAETSFVAMTSAPDSADLYDLGPVFPGVEAQVADDQRLCVRTPYAARAVETADGRWHPLADGAGWITLDDHVAIVDGRLRMLGRADARINIGGALHDPAPVEDAFADAPWVTEVAVVAVPDARRSAMAVAAIVAADDLPTAGVVAADARVACAHGAFPIARVVVIDTEPPRTAGGKLDRRAVAEGLAAGTLPTLDIA
jgi:long-chain acyl-CoA synthetase